MQRFFSQLSLSQCEVNRPFEGNGPKDSILCVHIYGALHRLSLGDSRSQIIMRGNKEQ